MKEEKELNLFVVVEVSKSLLGVDRILQCIRIQQLFRIRGRPVISSHTQRGLITWHIQV